MLPESIAIKWIVYTLHTRYLTILWFQRSESFYICEMSLILVITWYACSRHFQETLSSPLLALPCRNTFVHHTEIIQVTHSGKMHHFFLLETVKIEKVDLKWIFLPDSVLILNFTKFYQFYECRYWFSTPTSEINRIWAVSLTLHGCSTQPSHQRAVNFFWRGGVENETKNVRGK